MDWVADPTACARRLGIKESSYLQYQPARSKPTSVNLVTTTRMDTLNSCCSPASAHNVGNMFNTC